MTGQMKESVQAKRSLSFDLPLFKQTDSVQY